MPKLRYLFHAVSRSSYYEDIEGAEFDLDADAMTHAAVIALELAIDTSLLGFSRLVVTHQSVIKTTFLLYFPKAGATLAA